MKQNSQLAQICFAGQPVADELVIDMHAHLGPWFAFPVSHAGSPEAMLQQMDALGIDIAIFSPHLAIGPDYQEGNRQAREAHEKYPDRLWPYFTPNPGYPWPEIEQEIRRWADDGILIGFKLHPGLHEYKTTDESLLPLYEYAEAHELPILSHEWNGEPIDDLPPMKALAQRYPHIQFLCAHSANEWEAMEKCVEAAADQDNAYLDLTGSIMYYGLLEEMVRRLGAEHVLFGTDIPFIDARPQVGRVLMAKLSDDQKRLILGLNAQRIFDLPRPV